MRPKDAQDFVFTIAAFVAVLLVAVTLPMALMPHPRPDDPNAQKAYAETISAGMACLGPVVCVGFAALLFALLASGMLSAGARAAQRQAANEFYSAARFGHLRWALRHCRRELLRWLVIGGIGGICSLTALLLAPFLLRSIFHAVGPGLPLAAELAAENAGLQQRLLAGGALWQLAPLFFVLRAVCLSWRQCQTRSFCRRCGYNLHGNVSGRCPECGTPRRGWVVT